MSQRGLEEVIAASTRLSDVDGKQGRLWYVGYDIHDLAGRTSYEEVVHLLHELRLPNQTELDALNDFMVEEREVSKFLRDDLMPTLAQQTSPMSMLRTSVSAAWGSLRCGGTISWPVRRRWYMARNVGVRAISRRALRSLAAGELSQPSGSYAEAAETLVRSIDIGEVC